MGRPPKPTHLKIVAGNPGHRPLNDEEPKPVVRIPKRPPELTDEAAKEWKRIAKELHELGLLTNIDRAALSAYCQAWGRWIESQKSLVQFGTIVKSPTGYPMQSPFLAINNEAFRQFTAMLTEFGMTPAARSRIRVSRAGKESGAGDDDFA
jgi:P27 family predicted phage terminase small subunit